MVKNKTHRKKFWGLIFLFSLNLFLIIYLIPIILGTFTHINQVTYYEIKRAKKHYEKEASYGNKKPVNDSTLASELLVRIVKVESDENRKSVKDSIFVSELVLFFSDSISYKNLDLVNDSIFVSELRRVASDPTSYENSDLVNELTLISELLSVISDSTFYEKGYWKKDVRLTADLLKVIDSIKTYENESSKKDSSLTTDLLKVITSAKAYENGDIEIDEILKSHLLEFHDKSIYEIPEWFKWITSSEKSYWFYFFDYFQDAFRNKIISIIWNPAILIDLVTKYQNIPVLYVILYLILLYITYKTSVRLYYLARTKYVRNEVNNIIIMSGKSPDILRDKLEEFVKSRLDSKFLKSNLYHENPITNYIHELNENKSSVRLSETVGFCIDQEQELNDKYSETTNKALIWIIRLGIIGTFIGVMLAFYNAADSMGGMIKTITTDGIDPKIFNDTLSKKQLINSLQNALIGNAVAIITSLMAHASSLLIELLLTRKVSSMNNIDWFLEVHPKVQKFIPASKPEDVENAVTNFTDELNSLTKFIKDIKGAIKNIKLADILKTSQKVIEINDDINNCANSAKEASAQMKLGADNLEKIAKATTISDKKTIVIKDSWNKMNNSIETSAGNMESISQKFDFMKSKTETINSKLNEISDDIIEYAEASKESKKNAKAGAENLGKIAVNTLCIDASTTEIQSHFESIKTSGGNAVIGMSSISSNLDSINTNSAEFNSYLVEVNTNLKDLPDTVEKIKEALGDSYDRLGQMNLMITNLSKNLNDVVNIANEVIAEMRRVLENYKLLPDQVLSINGIITELDKIIKSFKERLADLPSTFLAMIEIIAKYNGNMHKVVDLSEKLITHTSDVNNKFYSISGNAASINDSTYQIAGIMEGIIPLANSYAVSMKGIEEQSKKLKEDIEFIKKYFGEIIALLPPEKAGKNSTAQTVQQIHEKLDSINKTINKIIEDAENVPDDIQEIAGHLTNSEKALKAAEVHSKKFLKSVETISTNGKRYEKIVVALRIRVEALLAAIKSIAAKSKIKEMIKGLIKW